MSNELYDDTLTQGEEFIDGVLSHHGVKGMKWGVRKRQVQKALSKNKPKLKPYSRTNNPKFTRSNLHNLTDKEIQSYLKRVDMETKFKNLHPTRAEKVDKFIQEHLAPAIKNFAKDKMLKKISHGLIRKKPSLSPTHSVKDN